MKKKKKRRTLGDVLSRIVLLLAVGVFLFSAAKLTMIFLEYKAGSDEYERMQEFVSEVPKPEKEPDQETLGEAVEDKTPRAPEVDWEGLKNINSEIIGWIRIEGTEIDYPVVKGQDNDYYLKHTFEGNSNIAGAIFVDYNNSSDFQDQNTMIYGHNMRNGSMFGTLQKHYKNQESIPGTYIWLCTPEKNYRYEIFSSHVVDAVGETYTLSFQTEEQFATYLDRMARHSSVAYEVPVTAEDKIITLSTCTGNDATRFVVQARREGEY